jgi:EmrB/QacA subfamily drug resistance transporter
VSSIDKQSVENNYIPLRLILPITSIGIFMSAMDGSIVNVSLKTIADDLNTDINGVRWVVIAYLLTISSLIGLSGSLGDIFGRKKVFQSGMVVFSLGSLFCSLSQSLPTLVLSRVIQAIGASAIMANGLAIVITYINPKIRGRAIGINSVVVAGSLATGPVVGGILTQLWGWQSIFLLNIPVGIIGFFATQLVIKETPRSEIVDLDLRGMGLFAFSAFAFITGFIFMFDGYLFGGFLFVISFFGIYQFYQNEVAHSNPILPVNLIKDKQIMMGVGSAIFAYMSINTLIFLFPFYLQEILEYNQSKTGFFMAVVPLSLAIAGPITGFLAERIKAKKLATAGISIQTISLIVLGISFIVLKSKFSILFILVLTTVNAAFLSVFTNSNSTSIMNASPKSKISIISGTLNLSRNIGFTMGTAISSTFFTLFQRFFDPERTTEGKEFESAYYLAIGFTFLLFAFLNSFGIILSWKRGEERLNIT